MNSLNQQQYLADFAPTQSLDKYAKGADPRVISGIVALSEMQQQAAQRQRAAMANGAAQGQMPTVRDKIMQMFQQANQPRQQPQQQPNPMMQRGIMAQAHPQMQTAPMPQEAPQEVPQEAQMYHGGVARLPVNNQMFGYANGGIIAFPTGGDVPKAEVPMQDPEFDAEGNPRSRSEREAIIEQNARLRSEQSNAQDLGDLQRRRLAGLGAINPVMAERMDQYYKPRRPNVTDLSQVSTPVVGASPDEAAAARAEFAATDPRRVGIARSLPANKTPPRAEPPGGPPAPPSAPPTALGAKPPTIDQLLEQQRNLLQAANAPVGPQVPEKSITEKATDYLKAQDDYVRKTGDSEAAKKLSALYDKAEKRALADDDAQAAQRAADARNNLWSYLSNFKGSSVAAGARSADAALQPLLAEQKKTNAEYRKYSYERDMNREKARVEAIAAEDARKRGEFAKAIEHEQKERTYMLDAQKAKDLADHYKRSDTNQLLNIEATRQTAKEGHQVQREGHLTQEKVANIYAAAQRAGYERPGETERLMTEYEKRVKEQGQKAADAWLDSIGKITGVTKGYNLKEEGLDIQRDKAVTAALKDYEPYNRVLNKIASLEGKERTGKLKPPEKAELDAARAAAKKYYDDKYQELHKTRPSASMGAAPQRVTTREEYAKLKPGTTFIAPDGSVRTKPEVDG